MRIEPSSRWFGGLLTNGVLISRDVQRDIARMLFVETKCLFAIPGEVQSCIELHEYVLMRMILRGYDPRARV